MYIYIYILMMHMTMIIISAIKERNAGHEDAELGAVQNPGARACVCC